MESMRENWTDERLDDLNRRVGEGFNRVDAEIRALRSEMATRFDSVDASFDAMHRTMIQFCGIMIAALIGLAAAQLGLIVTKL